MNNRFVALIPAYEPDIMILNLIGSLKENGFETVVVDDGSGPAYSKLFKKVSYYAALCTHGENLGKGCALKTGFSYIQEHYGDDTIIVTVDADGQHRVEDALMICEIAKKHPDTLVLGSRKLKENVPMRSRFGNSMTRLVYGLSTGLKVYDTQTGLRAFHMNLLPYMLTIQGERYEYEMNMLLEFAKKHIPIIEKEIETIYINNNAGSHFDTVRDSYRVYKEILKFSASSFLGFLTDYVLYSVLLLVTGNLRVANIGARIVSSLVNFTINCRYVFESKNNPVKSAVSYFMLAAVILFANTYVLAFLVETAGIGSMLAKILTEILFFVLSWMVQRFFIFRKKEIMQC